MHASECMIADLRHVQCMNDGLTDDFTFQLKKFAAESKRTKLRAVWCTCCLVLVP